MIGKILILLVVIG